MEKELKQLNKALRKLETAVEKFVANQLDMAKQIDSTRKVIDEVLLENKMDDAGLEEMKDEKERHEAQMEKRAELIEDQEFKHGDPELLK